ncbi:MAG: hypothetical protein HC925_02630, partial [Coleofasciculaceae cyanobacterium SM2_3_26]|nr:hypothetical protein [Coleofasciculaceae cyanobacterium SM2_3_26]
MSKRKSTGLIHYERVRSQMRTGDVVAFSGNVGFSKFIKWATRSPYSHVGMVYHDRLNGGFGDSVMRIESTTETNHLDAYNEGAIAMQAWLRETHNQQVPYDFVQVYGAALDMFDRIGYDNKENFNTLFCSELVNKALKIAGVLDEDLNASEQTPADVVNFPCFKAPVPD